MDGFGIICVPHKRLGVPARRFRGSPSRPRGRTPSFTARLAAIMPVGPCLPLPKASGLRAGTEHTGCPAQLSVATHRKNSITFFPSLRHAHARVATPGSESGFGNISRSKTLQSLTNVLDDWDVPGVSDVPDVWNIDWKPSNAADFGDSGANQQISLPRRRPVVRQTSKNGR